MKKYNTEQRKLLIDFFKNSSHNSLSAADVYNALKDSGIGMSSVYRNIAEMEAEGIIRRVSEKTNNKSLYQYIHPEHCIGIVHLICEKCNATFHLNRHISHMLTNIALENNNFHINEGNAVLYGTCENCY